MISYKNTKYIVRTEDGDTEFINTSAGVLHGDTLAHFLLIIWFDYVLKKALYRMISGLPLLGEGTKYI